MNSQEGRLLFLHALTPVHAGTGQAVAVVDLPVAREKATGWPIIPASGLRGTLRSAMSDLCSSDWVAEAFGPLPEQTSEGAGGLCFTDQRILLFPVRSFFGTYAYATSPLVVFRFLRDCSSLGARMPFPALSSPPGELQALVVQGSALARAGKAYFEDLDLEAVESDEAQSIATALAEYVFPAEERQPFRQRFAILSDTAFDFLCETATEVTARIRLQQETKTVQDQGLWYEETVPAEAVFHGLVVAGPHARERSAALLDPFDKQGQLLIQVGGLAGVGRGFSRLIVRGVP